MEHTRQQLLALLEERLTPKRLYHSLCVEQQAALLAGRYGADEEKAALAGLLHDICRCMPEERQLKYLKANGILLDRLTMRHPGIWHAAAGRLYLERELGIADREVLGAVRWHTTGRPEMSVLEQVVFLADVTSQDRSFPDLEKTRQLAMESLGAGMVYVLGFVVGQMARSGQVLVRETWEAYNYYAERVIAHDPVENREDEKP